MNFYASDFETASYNKHSACSIAIVKIENSRIVDEFYTLIKPETLPFWRNTQVHGIHKSDVASTPKFPEVWQQIQYCLQPNRLVVTHNASFDCSVLAGCLDYYGLGQSNCLSLCTVKTSHRLFSEFPNHRLNTVYENLNITLNNYHDALEDSRTCTKILLQREQRFGVESLKKLVLVR